MNDHNHINGGLFRSMNGAPRLDIDKLRSYTVLLADKLKKAGDNMFHRSRGCTGIHKSSVAKHYFLGLLLLSWVVAFPFTLYAQLGLTNGLIAYYPFDGNANDIAGTNNGVSHGATLTTNRFGIPNSAYFFNGKNAYIQTVHPMQDLTTATWSLWVDAATIVPISDSMTMLCDSDYAGNNDCTIQFRVLGNGIGGIAFVANKNIASSNISIITNGVGAFTERLTNNWLQIVWVMTPTNQMAYINGTNVANLSIAANDVGYHNAGFVIGAGDFYASYVGYFSGILDDIRVYNRALSTTEVHELYQYESQPPQLTGATLALRLNTSNLVVGGTYQIQASSDLISWTNYGTTFVAQSTNAPQYVDIAGQYQFFRILASP